MVTNKYIPLLALSALSQGCYAGSSSDVDMALSHLLTSLMPQEHLPDHQTEADLRLDLDLSPQEVAVRRVDIPGAAAGVLYGADRSLHLERLCAPSHPSFEGYLTHPHSSGHHKAAWASALLHDDGYGRQFLLLKDAHGDVNVSYLFRNKDYLYGLFNDQYVPPVAKTLPDLLSLLQNTCASTGVSFTHYGVIELSSQQLLFSGGSFPIPTEVLSPPLHDRVLRWEVSPRSPPRSRPEETPPTFFFGMSFSPRDLS